MAMKTTLPVLALGILASCLAVRRADAAIASASLSVTATVQVSCVASAVTVDCSNSVPFNVSLSTAVARDANLATRTMLGSGFALLRHALGPNLGGIANGRQAGDYDPTGFGNSSALELAFRSRLSAQHLTPGAYPESIIVMVTY